MTTQKHPLAPTAVHQLISAPNHRCGLLVYPLAEIVKRRTIEVLFQYAGARVDKAVTRRYKAVTVVTLEEATLYRHSLTHFEWPNRSARRTRRRCARS